MVAVFRFLLLLVLALPVQAKQTITIIYGFSPADNAANYDRTLIEEANKIQDKYTFIFDAKPGGGQAVAVNHVKNSPDTIFSTSGAFWLRPTFYPKESWNVNDWKIIMTQCNAPFSVASVNYKTWAEVPKDKPLTIAVSGLGVFSHMIALQIIERYPNMRLVPYKSTVEGMLATVSGQVDFTIGFVGDQENWTNNESKTRLTILGTTGNGSGKYPSLVNQGFPKVLAKLDTPYAILVPRTFDPAKAKEIRNILVRAEKSPSVRASYAVDSCVPFSVPEDKLDAWFDEQHKTISGLGKGVILK